MMYRYYLTQRPPMPGAFPNRPDNRAQEVCDYGDRVNVPDVEKPAWGHVDYKESLSPQEMREYELVEGEPFYMNKETGEVLSLQMATKQFIEEYDGNDPTNLIAAEEYYVPVH